MITCREVYGFLDDYLGGGLDLSSRVAFIGHLALCRACRRYLRTYKTSIKAARSAEGAAPPAPAEAPEELIQAILAARAAAFKAPLPEGPETA